MEGSLPSFQRCNPSLPVALKFYLLLGVVSGLDYYLSFAKDIAFFSGKARIRITILNDSLIDLKILVYFNNSYYFCSNLLLHTPNSYMSDSLLVQQVPNMAA